MIKSFLFILLLVSPRMLMEGGTTPPFISSNESKLVGTIFVYDSGDMYEVEVEAVDDEYGPGDVLYIVGQSFKDELCADLCND